LTFANELDAMMNYRRLCLPCASWKTSLTFTQA